SGAHSRSRRSLSSLPLFSSLPSWEDPLSRRDAWRFWCTAISTTSDLTAAETRKVGVSRKAGTTASRTKGNLQEGRLLGFVLLKAENRFLLLIFRFQQRDGGAWLRLCPPFP
ncbi:unnamed protein product, partial [Brassica rapa]